MNYKNRKPKRRKWARRGYWSEGLFAKRKIVLKEFEKEKLGSLMGGADEQLGVRSTGARA